MQENNSNNQKQGGSGAPKQGGLSWSTPTSTPTPAPIQKPASMQIPAKTAAPAAAAPVVSNNARYVGIVAIVLIAGAIIVWGFSALRSPAGETATGENQNAAGTSTSATPGLGSDTAFSVVSPQPAGRSVAIARAVVSAPTWVVVYESKEGKPGNALGAALFFPGGQSGTVGLLRATVAGKSYFAVRQLDDGDRKFSLKGDQFLSEGGEVQWIPFEAQ